MLTMVFFAAVAGPITAPANEGVRSSSLAVVKGLADAVPVDRDRALAFVAPGSVFQLGDYNGPTPAKALVERLARCRIKSITKRAALADAVEAVWDCPHRADQADVKRELRITFKVARSITGGIGEFVLRSGN